MFCQFCGTVLDDTARFCKSCARPISENPLPLSVGNVPGVRIRVTGNSSALRWAIISVVAVGAAMAGTQVFNWLSTEVEMAASLSHEQMSRAFYFEFVASIAAAVSAGIAIKKIGIKKAFLVAALCWALAYIGYSAVSNFFTLAASRLLWGAGSAVYLPLGIYVISRWLPKSEQALAVGMLLATSLVGGLFLPVLLQMILPQTGWRSALILLGLAGLVWAVVWQAFYHQPETHPLLARDEFNLIQKDWRAELSAASLSLSSLMACGELWGLVAATFIVNLSLTFFNRLSFPIAQKFNLGMKGLWAGMNTINSNFLNLGLPMAKILGAIVGGLVFGYLFKKEKSSGAARKITFWVGAGLAPFALLIGSTDSAEVAFAGYAISGFGIWVLLTALYALPLNLFESDRAATAVGLMFAASKIASWLFLYLLGTWDWLGKAVPVDELPSGKVLLMMSVLPLGAAAILTALTPAVSRFSDRQDEYSFAQK
ncbi:MAG: MFS transporter [Acidobacteria bacterium]|nr:MFS transporter [Acidobacteriota bacterium]